MIKRIVQKRKNQFSYYLIKKNADDADQADFY